MPLLVDRPEIEVLRFRDKNIMMWSRTKAAFLPYFIYTRAMSNLASETLTWHVVGSNGQIAKQCRPRLPRKRSESLSAIESCLVSVERSQHALHAENSRYAPICRKNSRRLTKPQIKCHMNDDKPPCTRCKRRGLSCSVNRSLQAILESDASYVVVCFGTFIPAVRL